MPGGRRIALEAAISAVVALALSLIVFGPLLGDLDVGWSGGDMLSTYVNTATWGGFSYPVTTQFGAPLGMNLNYFPGIDITENTFAMIVNAVTGSTFLGLNLLLVLSFPLVAALLLLTALTIPSAVVLIAVIAVQAVRRSIALRGTAVWVGAIAVGLLAQWLTASSAAKPRAITVGRESFDAWLNAVPDTILTYWPGMQLSEYTLFDVFTVSPLGITGALVVLAITVGGVVLVVRGGGERVGIGLLLLSGIAYGAGPSLIGPTNNRYFVVPLLLWGAAVMVALDPVIRRSRPWVVASVVVVVLVLWWPAP